MSTLNLRHDENPEIAEAALFTLTQIRSRLVVNLNGFPADQLDPMLERLPDGWHVQTRTPNQVVLTAADEKPGNLTVTAFSSNIKGTPAMSRDKVRHDVVKVLRKVKALGNGVGGFQEIGSNKKTLFYRSVVRKQAARLGFGVTGLTTENPIVWDLSKYRYDRAGTARISEGHSGGGFDNPPRSYSWVELRDIATGRHFYVVDTHWANAAWNGTAGASAAIRRLFWTRQFAAEDKFIESLKADGKPVFTVGDYNSHGRAMPKFLPRQHWLAGGSSSDHVAYWSPGKSSKVGGPIAIGGLFTDHATIAGTATV